MQIIPGNLYYVQFENTNKVSDIRHPYVVVTVDSDTVIVCALTSNIHKVSMPGNVLLEAGEGNLPRQSVIEVSKVFTVKLSQLGALIGALDGARVRQISDGIEFVERLRSIH